MKKIILLSSILILFACGDYAPPPEQGVVLTKKFTPAHWEGGYEEECSYGYHYDFYEGEYVNGYHCDDVYERHHHWVDDAWSLHLEDCVITEKGDEECNDGWLRVDETTYHDFAKGNYYPEPR